MLFLLEVQASPNTRSTIWGLRASSGQPVKPEEGPGECSVPGKASGLQWGPVARTS